MKDWKTEDIPDLDGKVAVVTGGNTGLGFRIALELAKKNAHVVIASRDRARGWEAAEKIRKETGSVRDVDVIPLDLTDFRSIRKFATSFLIKHDTLDILVNNAAVVNLANRQVTKEGLEMHMATNHYGHFALTGHLLSAIKNSKGARVITMSSGSYRSGKIDFDDLNWTNRVYNRSRSYGDSKLANLLFALELDRLFKKNNKSAISLAAHPGLSATERQQKIGIGGMLTKMMAQPVEIGALPALMAATYEKAEGKQYYGPRWMIRGYPRLEKLKSIAENAGMARKLWKFSEELTDVEYKF
ncbi:oxidoreductase [Fulvitalea axinellae]